MRDIEAEAMKGPEVEPDTQASVAETENVNAKETTLGEMLDAGPDLNATELVEDDFLISIRNGYAADSLFKLVLESPQQYKQFTLQDGLIFTLNRVGAEVVCIPRANHGPQSLQGVILDQAHQALGHYGFQ